MAAKVKNVWQRGHKKEVYYRFYRRTNFTANDLWFHPSQEFRGWIQDEKNRHLWYRHTDRDVEPMWVAKIKTKQGWRRFTIGPVHGMSPTDARRETVEFCVFYEEEPRFRVEDGRLCVMCNRYSVRQSRHTSRGQCIGCYLWFRGKRIERLRLRMLGSRIKTLKMEMMK
jgi:hypothetical protein